MSDAAALPKGLAAVPQHTLLPKLSLAGLQACAQTCSELRQAVMEAPWGVWRSAWEQAGMPPDNLARCPDPCSRMGRLAKQHAAIRAGPAWCRTIPDLTSVDYYTIESSPTITALQPDFAQLASLCGHEVILTPTDPTDDAGYAGCSVDAASMESDFPDVWAAQEPCSPNGMYLLASNASSSRFSLYACRPTLRPLNRIRMAGPGNVVHWAPNCQQFCILTSDKAYVASVPGYAGRAAEVHTVSEARLCFGASEPLWSPCSSYLAVSTLGAGGIVTSRLIVCAKHGTVLSRLPCLPHENNHYRPLAWVRLDDRLRVAYYRMLGGTGAGAEIWVQGVEGSEPWGGFLTNRWFPEIGYRIAGGHRVADLTGQDGCVVLYNLTREGLGCPAHEPAQVAGAVGSHEVLAAWAPQAGVWLAVLDVKREVMDTYKEGSMHESVQTACLHVLDGRSGQAVFEVTVVESSFEIIALKPVWSTSSSCLLVCLQLCPDDVLSSGDANTLWVSKHFRFG